jgi:hypothetical protein
VIRSPSGKYVFVGATELVLTNIAKEILKISLDDLLERMETPTDRQAKRDLMVREGEKQPT